MEFNIDHDLHIHSLHSRCSRDPEQTTERILQYGISNGFQTLCLTDHYWDPAVPGGSEWYLKQGDIREMKPLPQDDTCRFLFGCEGEMDRHFTIGLSKEKMAELDFIVIPTTHLHMKGFTFEERHNNIPDKTALFIARFEAFLAADLPFRKVGLAHITCPLIHSENDGYLEVLNGVSDNTFEQLFKGCAQRGCGVELNIEGKTLQSPDILPTVLRPYQIAKEQGCKFYLGSDAHHPAELEHAKERFKRIVELLELTEEERFTL